jgi:hypothetical protein
MEDGPQEANMHPGESTVRWITAAALLLSLSGCSPGPGESLGPIAVVATGATGSLTGGGEPIRLDCDPTCPSFDLTGGGVGDPLFAPATLGIHPESFAYAGASQLAMAVKAIKSDFPLAHEVFLSYLGNPAFANPGFGRFAAGSNGALISSFAVSGQTVVTGRTAAARPSEPTQFLLGGETYSASGTRYVSPLVIDLRGRDLPINASGGIWYPHPGKLSGPYAAFDIDGDGFREVTEWVGPGNALLTTSPDPRSGRDLLGTAGGWKDGFERLAREFDRDGNGLVEGPELEGLYAWEDVNVNGIADPGEVASLRELGIVYLRTTHENYQSVYYGSLNGNGSPGFGTLWDWWPNFASVNREPGAAVSGSIPAWVGHLQLRALRGFSFSARPALVEAAPGLKKPFTVTPEELVRVGVHLDSYAFALLGRGGRLALGFDRSQEPPRVARLVALTLGALGGIQQAVVVRLPFEEVFQVALEPEGRFVLALGNQGSRLVVVDLQSRRVLPPGGLDLREMGLRASAVAGHTGTFWFSAWRLGPGDVVLEERIWELTPCGIRPGLSLSALQAELGDLRQFVITGPDSGFFVTATPTGAEEQLVKVEGRDRQVLRTALSFGGLAAVPGAVAYTFRGPDAYEAAIWRSDGVSVSVARRQAPVFYPMMTTGRGSLVVAELKIDENRAAMVYLTSSAQTGWSEASVLTAASPGQGRAARGAMAHYGPRGLDLFPLPDEEPLLVPPVRPPAGHCSGR